jgi:hypothetical protein
MSQQDGGADHRFSVLADGRARFRSWLYYTADVVYEDRWVSACRYEQGE